MSWLLGVRALVANLRAHHVRYMHHVRQNGVLSFSLLWAHRDAQLTDTDTADGLRARPQRMVTANRSATSADRAYSAEHVSTRTLPLNMLLTAPTLERHAPRTRLPCRSACS